AWIMRASRNLALDVVRRRKVFQNKQAEISRLMDRDSATSDEAIFSEDEISDDRLRLMFVCCHPAIPAEAQVALALKTLCGFSVTEISHAFLTTEAAIAKRLTRAKQKIHQARIPFEIPAGRELGQRLQSAALERTGPDALGQIHDRARHVSYHPIGSRRRAQRISSSGRNRGLSLRSEGLRIHQLAANPFALRPVNSIRSVAGRGSQPRRCPREHSWTKSGTSGCEKHSGSQQAELVLSTLCCAGRIRNALGQFAS